MKKKEEERRRNKKKQEENKKKNMGCCQSIHESTFVFFSREIHYIIEIN
jgi:hypothetical protein